MPLFNKVEGWGLQEQLSYIVPLENCFCVFTLHCDTSKRFYKGLYGFCKSLWGNTSAKIKCSIIFSKTGVGMGRVNVPVWGSTKWVWKASVATNHLTIINHNTVNFIFYFFERHGTVRVNNRRATFRRNHQGCSIKRTVFKIFAMFSLERPNGLQLY